MERHSEEEKAKAVTLFEKGRGYFAAASFLDISPCAVEKWLMSFRANGREALFVRKNRAYDLKTKLKVIKRRLEDGASADALRKTF